MDIGRLPGEMVLLAGGEARRLGRRKETLELGGRPILERHLELWSPLFERVRISIRSGRTQGVPAGIDTIEDPDDITSLIDLVSFLIREIDRPFWLLAVDLPVIPAEIPQALFAAHRPGYCVFPEHDRGVECLSAIYDPGALEAIDRMRAAGERALQRIAESAPSIRLQYPEEFPPLHGVSASLGPFFNVNTPEDLSRLERALSEEETP